MLFCISSQKWLATPTCAKPILLRKTHSQSQYKKSKKYLQKIMQEIIQKPNMLSIKGVSLF